MARREELGAEPVRGPGCVSSDRAVRDHQHLRRGRPPIPGRGIHRPSTVASRARRTAALPRGHRATTLPRQPASRAGRRSDLPRHPPARAVERVTRSCPAGSRAAAPCSRPAQAHLAAPAQPAGRADQERERPPDEPPSADRHRTRRPPGPRKRRRPVARPAPYASGEEDRGPRPHRRRALSCCDGVVPWLRTGARE